MGEEVEHNCFLAVSHHLHDAYSMAVAMEHRGRDSTGLFAWGEHGIDVLKWKGSASSFGNKALQRNFPAEKYHTFGIHGRYRTRGSREIDLREGHPIVIGGKEENHGDHVYIRGCKTAIIHNGQVEERFLERLGYRNRHDTEGLLHFYEKFGIEDLMREIPDGFTFAIADNLNVNGTIIARGRHGLKPGIFGIKDGFDCFASESAGLLEIRATIKDDLIPGAIYHFRPNGKFSNPRVIVDKKSRHCFFEYQYIAHPVSLIDRLNVVIIRKELGEKLADEFSPEDVDFVTYVPESPIDAAYTYAGRRGLPLIECFYKVNGNRSFQASTQEARDSSIKNNLNLIDGSIDLIRGKRGIVIDDSFVRGTVLRRAKNLLYNTAGVEKAYFASLSPMIGIIGEDGVSRGCDFGGVDMPSEESENHRFLARGKTPEEISKEIGAEVYFLSIKGLKEVFERRGMPYGDLCTYCIGGEHPFRDFKLYKRE